jgi:hypothetical protein
VGYLLIENFNGGVDRRRPIYALKPGTLWSCSNAHISMGGDIELRKAFSDRGEFGSNTFGLVSVGDSLYTFGSDAPGDVTLPSGVLYQRLSYPGAGMTALVDVDLFDGKLYVLARFGDGSVQHFYDGILVAAWNDGIVRPYMSNLAGMATLLAALIDASANYSATAAGNVITVVATALNQAFTVETFAENGGATDDETMVYVETVTASPGVAQEGTLTLGGTFDPGDRFGVKLSTGSPAVDEYFGNIGKPWGDATCVKTHKRKVYVGAGSILFFSKVNDPTSWNSDVDAGAGFINVANHAGGSEDVQSIELYQGRLGAWSRRAIQLWTMQNDDDLNNLDQTLLNTGTRSPHSTLEFAGNDVFYLDDLGMRSIRARDASNNAFASGVGAAINPLVREWMRTGASESDVLNCVVAVEPEFGRLWVVIGTRIYVYSYFPDTGIAAWTWYEPGFTISDLARTTSRVWARANNRLYLYGGNSGDEFGSDYTVTIEMPFTGAQKDGTYKQVMGMDIAATGAWSVQLRIDPNDLYNVVQMGENEGFTFNCPDWEAVGHTTHIAPVLTHQAAGAYASLSKLAIYYQGAEESS